MKLFFKYLGLTSILICMFYYTNNIINNYLYNDILFQEIKNNSDNYNIEAVSASIEDNYIIPGLYGYQVNVIKSYNNMKKLETFNKEYLIYDKVVPNISIDNNIDKIIKYGNSSKNEVSLIAENNNNILDYSRLKNIRVTRLINIDTFSNNDTLEQINNDYNNYNEVEHLLDKNNINKDICFIKNNKNNLCNNKYLVTYSLELNNYNLSNVNKNIKSGYIILIDDSLSISNFKLLYKKIKELDLNIVYLSSLIKEERD